MTQATYLRTATIPIGELHPFPGNARRGDVPVILESLRRNGQYRSLVVRETDDGRLTVLTGNHTLQAITEHGPGDCRMTLTAPDGTTRPCGLCHNQPWAPAARCEIVHCDDDTAHRITLVDNRSAELGTYEETALAELVAGLDGDTTGTGYTDTDLDDLLRVLEETSQAEPADPYDEPEQPHQEQPPTTPPPSSPPPPAKQQLADPLTTPVSPVPQFSHERVPMVLHYPTRDRDEAIRLVSAARETFADDDTPAIVLRALRTLIAVLDCRHAHDGAVTVAALLRAAGADNR